MHQFLSYSSTINDRPILIAIKHETFVNITINMAGYQKSYTAHQACHSL